MPDDRARAGRAALGGSSIARGHSDTPEPLPIFWMHMQTNFDLKVAMSRRRALKLAQRA